MTTKNPKPISEARDPDARNALAALKRAFQNARELDISTNKQSCGDILMGTNLEVSK
jgi:hypothetical protein